MQVRLLGQFQQATSYTDTAANNDFALVTLAQPVGNRTGWMGLEWSNAASETINITTTGAVAFLLCMHFLPNPPTAPSLYLLQLLCS